MLYVGDRRSCKCYEGIRAAGPRTLTPERVPSPGELLRAELERRGWSQAKLALLCGVSMTTINRVISNRRGITPRLDAVLHRVLGSEPGYWLACNQCYRRSLGVHRSD